MADHPEPWLKEGLSPGEAYSRTLSPSLKARFTGRRQRRMISLGFDASDNDRRLLKMWNAEEDRRVEASDRAKRESISVFHSFLREGLLVATGHKTEKDASEYRIEGQPSPIPIRREAWTSLHINWRTGSAGKRKEPERFDLKIFPLLNSPLALEMLQGLTLSEVFARYVAGDPELKAAEEAVGDDAGAAAWRPNHHPRFDRTGIFWQASTLSPKAIEDENPSGVLQEDSEGVAANTVAQARIAALFELLRMGSLEAVGIDSNGDETLLPLSFWDSEKGYVDFKDGEAFLLNEAGKPMPVASAISLRAAIAPQAGVPGANRTASVWRLKSRETAKAFALRFFGGHPASDERPEDEIERAGGLQAFADAVSSASDGWLSSDTIRKALKAELDNREAKRMGAAPMKKPHTA